MGSYTAPEYGRKLLPVAIDDKAEKTPQSVWCSLPYDDSDLSKGYEDITYATFANAINQMAWFIEQRFQPSKTFDTFAYIGLPDITYMFVQMAAAKTGYKVLFSSHTNSLAGHLALMEKTETKFLLSATRVKVEDILASRPMEYAIIPDLEDFLNSPPVKHYPFVKTYEEAVNDPYIILHTSGSTGLPKPIVFTHGATLAVHHHRSLPAIDSASGLPIRHFFTGSEEPKRIFLPFFTFHAICSTVFMVGSVLGDAIYVPGFRQRAVTHEDMFDILDHCNAQYAFMSPSMVEDLARSPDVAKHLGKLEKVLYGGAPITEAAGKIFSKYTYLQDQWGITETGKVADLEAPPEDYAYCAFPLKSNGMEFVERADNLYEMIIRRTPESYPNLGIFWRCPEEDVFYPGDLWSPHPDPKKAKFVWKYEGRTDDLICWKNGINLHPAAYETKHAEHDLIRSVVIAGTGHRQPVLLLELVEPTIEPDQQVAIVDQIWQESVLPVNDVAPKYGQVAKTHVLIATPGKPFERSVKGTVARKATLRQYEAEIESVYQEHGDQDMDVTERLPASVH